VQAVAGVAAAAADVRYQVSGVSGSATTLFFGEGWCVPCLMVTVGPVSQQSARS
jgi:hypothetical protein